MTDPRFRWLSNFRFSTTRTCAGRRCPLREDFNGGMTEPGYTEDGVPTFDFVRDKIEGRLTTGEAAVELAGDPQDTEEQLRQREEAGRSRLDETRRSLRPE